MILLGIGTGRCGTQSLSRLLETQVRTGHERFVYGGLFNGMFFPKWNAPEKHQRIVIDRIEKELKTNGMYSEIALYLLQYVRPLIARFPDIKVVVVERERAQVVESYMNKTKGKDHWCHAPDRALYRPDPWDDCYPKYDTNDKRSAIGMYWDYYKTETDLLVSEFPDNVKKVKTEDLSDYVKCKEIMEFYQLPMVPSDQFDGFHANRSVK